MGEPLRCVVKCGKASDIFANLHNLKTKDVPKDNEKSIDLPKMATWVSNVSQTCFAS